MTERLSYAACKVEDTQPLDDLAVLLEEHGFELKQLPELELLRLGEVKEVVLEGSVDGFNTALAEQVEMIQLECAELDVLGPCLFKPGRGKSRVAGLEMCITPKYLRARDGLVDFAETQSTGNILPPVFSDFRWTVAFARLRGRAALDSALLTRMHAVHPTSLQLGRLGLIE